MRCCHCHPFQYPALPDYYKFILVTVLILMTLIEAIRLYLGYAGNLQEKVEQSDKRNTWIGVQTHARTHQNKSTSTHVTPVFVEGPRVGWILAAEHPAAVTADPVSAL